MRHRGLFRLIKYLVVRSVALFVAVVLGIYLTIWVANMGGYVDKIRRAEIWEQVAMTVLASPQLRRLPQTKVHEIIEEKVKLEEERLGLDRPFFLRSFEYLVRALSLNLGRAEHLLSDTGSRQVRWILLERLPATLVLFATSEFLLFFTAVYFALKLSRRYGSLEDKLIVGLAPTSAAPAWFYGIILIMLFAAVLRVLPFGGMVDAPPPPTRWGYALSVLKHLILPVCALYIEEIFIITYNWRTFFLIFSSEDYVELAKAKGVPMRVLERRHILRPTLPTIVTSFTLTVITVWMGAIILETVFAWPGLGSIAYDAIQQVDTPVILGIVIIYAYLLAISLLVLDFLYALLDPRIRWGGG